MACCLGVDLGGTFTDVALVEEASGRIIKLPTTPSQEHSFALHLLF